MGLSSKRLKIADIFMAFLETRANLQSNRTGFNVTRPKLAKLWPFQLLKKKRKKILQFEILMGVKGLITRIYLINPLVYSFLCNLCLKLQVKPPFGVFMLLPIKLYCCM